MSIPDEGKAFGRWLFELREASGLTQFELAQAAGISPRTIQRWEAGMHAPSDVIRVLTALGVRVNPPAPEEIRALNVQVREVAGLLAKTDLLLAREEGEDGATTRDPIVRRLEALEAQVAALPTAADLRNGLESIRRSIARATEDSSGAPPASTSRPRRSSK